MLCGFSICWRFYSERPMAPRHQLVRTARRSRLHFTASAPGVRDETACAHHRHGSRCSAIVASSEAAFRPSRNLACYGTARKADPGKKPTSLSNKGAHHFLGAEFVSCFRKAMIFALSPASATPPKTVPILLSGITLLGFVIHLSRVFSSHVIPESFTESE